MFQKWCVFFHSCGFCVFFFFPPESVGSQHCFGSSVVFVEENGVGYRGGAQCSESGVEIITILENRVTSCGMVCDFWEWCLFLDPTLD